MSYNAKQGLYKGLCVKVVVDGEIHEGEVTRVDSAEVYVRIPFYYFHSEKHGEKRDNPHLTIKEKPELVMI